MVSENFFFRFNRIVEFVNTTLPLYRFSGNLNEISAEAASIYSLSLDRRMVIGNINSRK